MATYVQFFSGRETVSTSSQAIYHLNQAVGLVNKKLQTVEALSNTNLAVVNFLVVHELLRESGSKARIHMKGLQKMVELRGGLSQLEDDDLLAVKFCK